VRTSNMKYRTRTTAGGAKTPCSTSRSLVRHSWEYWARSSNAMKPDLQHVLVRPQHRYRHHRRYHAGT